MATVTRTSDLKIREEIAKDVDAYQVRVTDAVEADGFAIDWREILRGMPASSEEEVREQARRRILAQLVGDDLEETVRALAINGEFIARYGQQRSEEELLAARVFRERPLHFAEASLATIEGAVAHWRVFFELTEDQVQAVVESLSRIRDSTFEIAGRMTGALVDRLAFLYAQAVASNGADATTFIEQAALVMPDASRAMLTAEYRTLLTDFHGSAQLRLARDRSASFPFLQYMSINDGRTTWWICLPMGTAGPGGKGYIAATDDGVWIEWRPPNHFSCRSVVSPISYREAQRLGILARDGRTKIAIIGSNPNRPFGDPPDFAEDPVTGTLRRVEPAEGFGA